MKTLIQKLHQILHGQIIVSPQQKFTALIFCVGLVHLTYFFMFQFLDMPFLMIYNFCSVILYLVCTCLAYREYFSAVFTCCIIEVNLHALLTCWFIGNEGGFTMFCIIIAPIAFYMAFSLSAFKRHVFTPCCAAAVSFLIFILGRILPFFAPLPYKDRITVTQTTLIYCLNASIAFFVLVFFSLLFILEIVSAQTSLKAQNRQLDDLAHRDCLTRLLNRRSMQQHLDLAIQTPDAPFCLVLCDIDDFKRINDTYGHECGDQVLIHIANLIRTRVGSSGHVCRWGGEEILLLLYGTVEDAVKLTEDIRIQIACITTLYQEREISHTMTFGVSPFVPSLSLEAMIRIADSNLYKGKRNGKNVVIY